MNIGLSISFALLLVAIVIVILARLGPAPIDSKLHPPSPKRPELWKTQENVKTVREAPPPVVDKEEEDPLEILEEEDPLEILREAQESGRYVFSHNLSFKARVLSGGMPVEGAHVRGEIIPGEGGGAPFFAIVESPETGASGETEAVVAVADDTPETALVCVGAFHPEYGTGAYTCSVSDLRSLPPEGVVILLERGSSLFGRVLDEDGNPINGAVVTLFTESPSDEVNVSGVGVWTREDGTFVLPGIGFDNVPRSVVVKARRKGETGGIARRIVRVTDCRGETDSFDLGAIQISLAPSPVSEAKE